MKKDPRINASSMSVKKYIAVFLTVLFLCGSYAGVYFLQIKESRTEYIVLSMLTYIIVLSAVVCLILAAFRHFVLMRPVRKVCEAARRVASGDFSVRIEPDRTDGKKDEFEVLFEDFNTMTAELASTEIMKSDFISNVSHEFKTPLAVIQNYATILQSEELAPEERREYTERIGSAAARMSVLVSNILQLNRLENQKINPDKQPFNLSEALSRCILGYDELLEEKDIELDIDMDQDILLTADEALLDTVWNNLMSNAVKFTPEGGTIRIGLERKNGTICVTVADTGCGMTEDVQRHIFDKFYQADTSHKMQGNGLGLALAKRIVDLVGGRIGVSSEPGKGTAFTVEFEQ